MILTARLKRLISLACLSTSLVGKQLVQKCSPLPNETERSTLQANEDMSQLAARARESEQEKGGDARLGLDTALLEQVERVVVDVGASARSAR